MSADGKSMPFAEHRVPSLLAAFEDTEEAGGAVSGMTLTVAPVARPLAASVGPS